MDNREVLIEKIARAMYFEDCGTEAMDDDAEPFRGMARIALAVVEEAQSPIKSMITRVAVQLFRFDYPLSTMPEDWEGAMYRQRAREVIATIVEKW